MKYFKICLLLIFCQSGLWAQQSIGLRFGTDLNYFPRSEERDLIPGWFSTGKFGVFFSKEQPRSSFEVGVNVNYKNFDDKGLGNFPVVMSNFRDDENSGFTSVEMDFKVGPKFWGIYPRIGYIVGYRFQAGGFQMPESQEINPFYLSLPFGTSFKLPTNFGTIGGGAFYLLGITNVLKNPDPQAVSGLYNGGRMRAINIEIVVTYGLQRWKR